MPSGPFIEQLFPSAIAANPRAARLKSRTHCPSPCRVDRHLIIGDEPLDAVPFEQDVAQTQGFRQFMARHRWAVPRRCGLKRFRP